MKPNVKIYNPAQVIRFTDGSRIKNILRIPQQRNIRNIFLHFIIFP